MRELALLFLVACGSAEGGVASSSEAAKALIDTGGEPSGCLAIPEPKELDGEAKIAWARGECRPDTLAVCAQQCRLGNATSCFVMATFHKNEDKPNAKCLMETAARGCELQHPASCAVLAHAYGKKDAQRAANLFHIACARGIGAGCAGLAKMWLTKGERVDEALALLEETCVGKGDYGIACYALGREYETGKYGPEQQAKAKDLFRRGCETHEASCGAFQKLGP